MKRFAWIALTLPALMAGPAPAAPAQDAKASDKKEAAAPEIVCDVQGEHYLIYIQGQADLPDGMILRIACDLSERGRKTEDYSWQIYAEVKSGAYKERYMAPRATMKPGAYRLDITLRDTQQEEVEKVLTKDQRNFRQTGTLVMGADTPKMDLALEVCKPLATGLRAAGAVSLDFAKHVAFASEGKLAAAAWKSWRSKAGLGAAAVSDMEKALGRKEAAYYLPSTTALAPLVARIQTSLDACETSAAGKATPETKKTLETAMLPTEDEATRALRPLYLDGLGLFAEAANEIVQAWAPPFEAGALAQVKKDAEQYTKAWPVFKALPWKGTYPIQFQLMDDIHKEMKALPAARSAPDGGKNGKNAKNAGKGGGGETADAIVARLRNYVTTYRGALSAEKERK